MLGWQKPAEHQGKATRRELLEASYRAPASPALWEGFFPVSARLPPWELMERAWAGSAGTFLPLSIHKGRVTVWPELNTRAVNLLNTCRRIYFFQTYWWQHMAHRQVYYYKTLFPPGYSLFYKHMFQHIIKPLRTVSEMCRHRNYFSRFVKTMKETMSKETSIFLKVFLWMSFKSKGAWELCMFKKNKRKKKEKWLLFVNATFLSILSKESFLYVVQLLLPLNGRFSYALYQNMWFMGKS